MELLNDKMKHIDVIMQDMDDVDFDGNNEMHSEFFVKGNNAFIFYDEEMGAMKLKVQDIDESEKEYIERAGVKGCKNGFDPMDLNITKNMRENSMRIQFKVLQREEYHITLLNEGLVKIFDENFTISAGKYDRIIDITGQNNEVYLNINQGKACYTKKIMLP